MSREEILFDAITNIREELVEEAQRYVFRKKRAVWRRYAGMAACLALIAALCFGAYGLSHILMNGMGGGSAAPMDAGGSAEQTTGAASGADGNAAPPAGDPEDGAVPEDSGDHIEGASSGAAKPEDPDPSVDKAAESFIGYILEVHETYLLVYCDGPVEVPTEGLEDLPEFREGDQVHVLCGAITSQDGVTTAASVEEIWLLEPESDAP